MKQLKTLYKEDPNVSVAIYEKGKTAGAPLKTQPLPISHYFEFSGMPRGKQYEIVLRASRPMADRRHLSEVTYTVDAKESSFTRHLIPLRKGSTS